METNNCICKTTDEDHLYVIAVVSNPARFKRRYQLFNEFCERMKLNPKVKLFTTELQLGDRPFATNATFKVRSNHNLWHKENLLNYTIQRLPSNAKYINCVDADISFLNPNWATETIEALQTYKIIQNWSDCIDLTFDQEIMETHKSFGYMYHKCNRKFYNVNTNLYKFFHSGYSFAFTRDAFDDIGGMPLFAIAGSADHHFWTALVGKVLESVPGNIHPNYKKACLNFQDLCERHIKRNIGFTKGIIHHYYHGKKKERQYKSRWEYLIRNNYDPLTDINLDSNGILKFTGNKPNLEYDLRHYASSRNEDSIE